MFRIILTEEHKQILKEALVSFCKIRLNYWSDYVRDIDSTDEKLFEEAYATACPNYKNIYKLVEKDGRITDIEGFGIKKVYLKVFKDNLNFSLKDIRKLLYIVEEFMRMRMGQFFIFVDDVAHNGWEYDTTDPDNDIKFQEYIFRRDNAKNMFERACKHKQTKTRKVLVAEDMYDVFKHHIWLNTPSMHKHYTVYSSPPMNWSGLKLPVIEEGG